MKTSLMPYTRTRLKTMPVSGYLLFTVFLFLCLPQNGLHAQSPRLSVQGILKKANGDAVNDDTYTLTFRLYTSENQAFNSAPWKEEQQGVEVVNGIYSTVLGNTSPLPSFNQQYFLGVTVGPMTNTSEMLPRVQLTSAPYALSIIGVNNQFPSSGQVIADSIDVNGGILTQNGAPGANGVNQNGYGFLGDKDSGLYSQAANEVSLYVNNIELIEVKPALVDIKTDATVDNLNLKTEGKLSYNGLDDWRLVETDYFQNDTEEWLAYGPTGGEIIGWNNGTGGVAPTLLGANTNFVGKYIRQSGPNQVLKKQFDLSNVGNYSLIKIKFKYYYLDTWDDGQDADRSFAAISETITGTGIRVGYTVEGKTWWNYGGDFGQSDLFNTANHWGGNTLYPDYTDNAEMTFFICDSCNDIFWLMFGASLNGDSFPNPEESFGVGMIEIWVK